MPFVLAVSGFSNSGKTTLCSKLIPLLQKEGIDTAYAKHTHENVLSPECSDTGMLSDCCTRVAIWGSDGVRAEEQCETLDTAMVAAKFFPGKQLLILEGGKLLTLPKIWVGSPLGVQEEVRGVVAYYDRDHPCSRERHFTQGEEAALAAFIASLVRGAEPSPAEIYCGDTRIPAKAFVGDFMARSIRGMLRSLKGDFDLNSGVTVHLRPRDPEE